MNGLGLAIRLALGISLLAGCTKQRFEKVPGETDLSLREVSIHGESGQPLHLDASPLMNKLGLRKGSAIYTDRYYNPFRLAEDRRRIQAYWQTGGYYEAEVLEPEVKIDSSVQVRWFVREGPRYELARVEIRSAPDDLQDELLKMVPSKPGQAYDLEAMRLARYAMATRIQREGYAHARVYSRSFVQRETRKFYWVYWVDTGPKTRIKSLQVKGQKRIQESVILARTGFAVGQPFDLNRQEKAEWDLLDTGAFAMASVQANVDTEMHVGDVPDSGGVLGPERIDEQGNLIPRVLPEELDIVIQVREAPQTQVKLRASVEADRTRLDAIAGGELWRRNLLGSSSHILLEGRIGYGHLWDQEQNLPAGVYGDALLKTVHPGFFARLVDGRLTVAYRDRLFPDFHLREMTAGPGLRSTPIQGLFLDLDVLLRRGQQVDLGPFDATTLATYKLPSSNISLGAQINASILYDQRNDPAEPITGYLFALRSTYSPGASFGDHRYLRIDPELRGYLPLSPSISLGVRASGGWLTLVDSTGVPQGPRFFGGGAFGFRGVGRERLSPIAPCFSGARCQSALVGGLSLAETSLELRYLPFLKQYGMVLFADAAGSTLQANPFSDGINLAIGLGPRLRLWYLPIAIDASYSPLLLGVTPSLRDSFQLFLRIGEAF